MENTQNVGAGMLGYLAVSRSDEGEKCFCVGLQVCQCNRVVKVNFREMSTTRTDGACGLNVNSLQTLSSDYPCCFILNNIIIIPLRSSLSALYRHTSKKLLPPVTN